MSLKNKWGIRYILKGVLYAFVISLIMLVVFTLLLKFTSLSESKTPMYNNITMIISVVIGSLYIGMKIKEKGWLNGAIVGLIYYLVIILINVLFIKSGRSPSFLFSKLVLSTLTGFIGGMIGINLS